MTGSDGRYTFTSLIAGTYAVSPFPSGKYMFSTDTSGSTFSIIEAGQNYEINFTSPISGSENYQNERSIRIYSVNCPEGMKILVKRQIFNYFFGSWESEGAETAQQLRRDGYYMRFQTLWNTKDSTKIYFESIPEIAWGSNYAVFDTFFIYADKERYKIWLHDGVISDAWYLDWKEKRVRWYH
jgi:hypothetical protein